MMCVTRLKYVLDQGKGMYDKEGKGGVGSQLASLIEQGL